jgi:hypothetical protein
VSVVCCFLGVLPLPCVHTTSNVSDKCHWIGISEQKCHSEMHLERVLVHQDRSAFSASVVRANLEVHWKKKRKSATTSQGARRIKWDDILKCFLTCLPHYRMSPSLMRKKANHLLGVTCIPLFSERKRDRHEGQLWPQRPTQQPCSIQWWTRNCSRVAMRARTAQVGQSSRAKSHCKNSLTYSCYKQCLCMPPTSELRWF